MKKIIIFCSALLMVSSALLSDSIIRNRAIAETPKPAVLDDSNDPFGIKRTGRLYGFDIEAPSFIPEDMTLHSTTHSLSENPVLHFQFENDDNRRNGIDHKMLSIEYVYLGDKAEIEDYLIKFNIKDMEVEKPIILNGVDAYIFSTPENVTNRSQGKIYITYYYNHNILTSLLSYNIESDELYHIFESIN